MAAPQTHFAITGLIQIFLMFVLNIKFNFWEWTTFWIWGVGIDIDHLTSWSYVKDVFTTRFPRLLKGGDFGEPSSNVRIPIGYFHIWTVTPFILIYLGFFYFVLQIDVAFWIIFLPWFIHWTIDRFQKSDEISFFYPWRDKQKRKWGYPVKSRKEMIISTLFAVPLFIFEIILFLKYIP